YLTIEHATKGPHPVHNNAAISLWYANAEMDHLTLMDNLGNPVFAQYSQVVLTNSVLHSDITGDLINVKYGEAEISHCNFIGNEQPDTDAIDYDEIENGVIEFVNIQGLYGINSDGIDLGEECVNIDIHDCFIFDCTDKGISVGQGSTTTISNVTIVNCNMGVGIKDLATVEMNQVTSYSNVTGVSCFEKNPGFGGGIASVSNSILSNSSESPVFADELSMVDVSYTLYDTDTLVGTGVFWANPLFADAPHFDFHVLTESPALTSGDQGQEVGSAYHDYSGTSDIMISDIQYFHPVNGEQEFLKLWNTGDETVDLSGYYIESAIYHLFPSGISLAPGEKLMLAKDINLFPPGDDQVYQWDSGQLSNGGEKLLLHDNHGIVVDYVKYSPDAPWPSTTLEDQYLTLISASLDNHFAESWTTDIFISDENLPQNRKGLHIYPNPAQGQMWLLLPEPLDHGIIRITDMSGRVVFEMNQVTAGTQVEIHPSLQDGLYLLTVLNGNGVVLGNERFVAQ
ncbi:MAG: lamin tail domain-containing protein, partial [Flavobacteriales bacterium]|nr:lamin tail domain-containing protein [Flavobacteriales bacterium]